MIEIPEAIVLSEQLNGAIKGKVITDVVAGYSPHKFAFFYGDPQNYASLLVGEAICEASPRGGLVEIRTPKARLVLVMELILVIFHQTVSYLKNISF